MIARTCVFPFLIALTSLPLLGTPQESLGDLARQLRQQQVKAGLKITKVYTNDNLPAHNPDEGRAATPGASSTPAVATPSDQAPAEGESRQAAKQTSKKPETGQAANKSEKPENKTKEFWQARFKSARAQLADAQERQQLAEDELNLLQIQDARALDSNVKAELVAKIKAKEDEVSERQAATEEAQKALEDLQKEFRAGGAPDEWSETETETSQ